MNRQELKTILQAEGIRSDCYDLDGGLAPEECYVISQVAGRWSVYYRERSLERGLKTFPTESTACEYLLNILREDPAVKESGEHVIVIGRLGDPLSKDIVFQTFKRGEEEFIPIFSDRDEFVREIKGSGFENQGISIDNIHLFASRR